MRCPFSPAMSCEAPLAEEIRQVLLRRPDAVQTIQHFIEELLAAAGEGASDEAPIAPRQGWRPNK
jgi:hypothetical protein